MDYARKSGLGSNDDDAESVPCSTLTDGEIETAARRATSDLGPKPAQTKFDDLR